VTISSIVVPWGYCCAAGRYGGLSWI